MSSSSARVCGVGLGLAGAGAMVRPDALGLGWTGLLMGCYTLCKSSLMWLVVNMRLVDQQKAQAAAAAAAAGTLRRKDEQ